MSLKKKLLIPFALFGLMGIVGIYVTNNVYWRTAVIRTFARGGWYIDSRQDTIYTLGYFGIRQYHLGDDASLKFIQGNDDFCKNTLIARSCIVTDDLIYVASRSYLGGVTEVPDVDYYNGKLIVLEKKNLDIVEEIPSDIKYVELCAVSNYLIVSGIMGFDVFEITESKIPQKVYKYRTTKRSEFQGADTFCHGGEVYVVFSRYTEGIQIWNFTNPTEPFEVVKVPTYAKGCMTFDVVAHFPYIYSTLAPDNGAFKKENDKRGVIVYNVENFDSITANHFLIPNDTWYEAIVGDKEPTFMKIYNDMLYVNFADKGVATFDISNPSHPRFIKTVDINNKGAHVQPFHITESGYIVGGNYWWDDVYVYQIK